MKNYFYSGVVIKNGLMGHVFNGTYEADNNAKPKEVYTEVVKMQKKEHGTEGVILLTFNKM